ncbi:hypothetical protein LSH36_291g01006 [Paralvinella palmiformis]|uniref:RIIa domain-containing protein n=1 Tax=Paralvinella palmiformis TaxID=53620 RepID=A0AAD9JJZ1_9ANNE|nr:hypothetical protein LSH36_291g01006 [Paralvinella palmiformis]
MAVPFSNTKLRVPRGFQNILEGLAREVLRSQPNDIYAFGAVYFEQLLKLREEIVKLEKAQPLGHNLYLNRIGGEVEFWTEDYI